MPDITIAIPDEWAERLAVLVEPNEGRSTIQAVIGDLIDHAQQGIYRPGAWERGWLCQAFGDEWEARLVPDTRPGMLSGDGRVIFQRPADA